MPSQRSLTVNITSELRPFQKEGKPNISQTESLQSQSGLLSAGAVLLSHTCNFCRQDKVWAGAVETLVNLTHVWLQGCVAATRGGENSSALCAEFCIEVPGPAWQDWLLNILHDFQRCRKQLQFCTNELNQSNFSFCFLTTLLTHSFIRVSPIKKQSVRLKMCCKSVTWTLSKTTPVLIRLPSVAF